MSGLVFPPEFLFGAATSAQQIEGATRAGGRGESIWDRYASKRGRIRDGSDSRVACDHYHRWREDIDLMQWLGLGAYRFSVAWPRILPSGAGRVNPAGLDFYDALVDRLLERGIEPFPTLDHWDLPQRLQERGGWKSRSTVEAFVRYSDVVSRRLGDRVRHWVTHNEPWCIAHLGYQQGAHAPGRKDPASSLQVAHHLLLSHGRATQVIRHNVPGARIGLVNIVMPVQAASDSPADQDAAREVDGAFNRWYLDPIYRGAYPADAIADRVRQGHLPAAELPFVHAGDMDAIRTPTDFLGLNYYSRSVVRAGADGRPEGVPQAPPEALTDMGWEVYPDGLRQTLLRLHQDYAPGAIFITENGAAHADATATGPEFPDPRRVDYFRTHLLAALQAMAEGVPLRGYFAWSLMDNFEWAEGLTKRFGLFHVDYSTLRRTPRESAHYYREVIASRRIDAAALAAPSRRNV